MERHQEEDSGEGLRDRNSCRERGGGDGGAEQKPFSAGWTETWRGTEEPAWRIPRRGPEGELTTAGWHRRREADNGKRRVG